MSAAQGALRGETTQVLKALLDVLLCQRFISAKSVRDATRYEETILSTNSGGLLIFEWG